MTVAEVVPYVSPAADLMAPPWLAGLFHWRNMQVPLVIYEIFNNKAFAGPQFQSRIAVINNTGESATRLPFIAFVSQGIPRLIRVKSEEIIERKEAIGPRR